MTQNWDVSRSDKSFTRPMRTVLIVGSEGMIAPSLLTAIENELPWVRVEITANVSAACAQFSYPVSLILLEPSLVEEAEASAELIRLCHAQAQVAEIMTVSGATHSRSESSGLVRSVLPMDIRLDLWLSVIQLMLSGGEYVPRNLMLPSSKPVASSLLNELTPRERQVLELVSEGCQNKTIASRLSLSEHTVKIHIHNIITKFGAQNRTEAAAYWQLQTPGNS